MRQYRHFFACSLLSAFALFPVGATAAENDLTPLIGRLKAYRYGSDTGVLEALQQKVSQARSDATLRSRLASDLAALLSTEAAFEAKQFACRELAFVGGESQVPALISLLPEENLAHYALLALARIPGARVDAALLAALPKCSDRTRSEVIDTLGNRGNPAAVPTLNRFLESADPASATAAASALAKVADPTAVQALRAAYLHASASLQPPLGEALLHCAARLSNRGENATALSLYTLLDKSANGPALQAAALRGIVLASGEEGVKRLIQALQEEGTRRQTVAADLARTVPGAKATRLLADALPNLSGRMQGLLIEALADRGDPLAAPAVEALCHSQDATVRQAALHALGSLGNAASAPLLLKTAASATPEERSAARESLGRLKGPTIDPALLKAMDGADLSVKQEAIRSLGERQAVAAVPRLLKAASGAQAAVSDAALHVLRDLAPPSLIPSLVDLTLALPADRRDNAIDAAIGVGRRDSGDTLLTLVRQRLTVASKPADKIALLTILGQVGGPSALDPLRKGLTDADPEVQNTALSLIAEWPTDTPMPELLHVVQTSSDARQRTLALRGYLRMAGANEQRSPTEALALYRQVASFVRKPEEKRLMLAGLGKIKSLASLQYASGFLADADVRGEAELAVTEIASGTMGAYPDVTRGALEWISKDGFNEDMRKRAADLLARYGKLGDFLSAWEVSPAYQQDGVEYKQLFETPFAPEQPGHQKEVPWRLMPVATSGEQPWLLDLLALYGGEQKVAYLRTEVWSETARDLGLEMGSDDGLKVWWNGQVILSDNTARAVVPGQEKVKVAVRAGWNQLLLKVTQNNQGWGACARFTNIDGTPATGLRFRVPTASASTE